VKVEADGDLHLALQDAAGNELGIVVCEIPAKPQCCSIHETVLVGRVRDSLFTLALLRS
jgi:hypothetical protein